MRLAFVTAPLLLFHPLAGFSTSEVEPNNTPETANVLLSGEVMESSLSDSHDVDYFKISGALGQYLTISCDLLSGGAVQVFNSEGEVVAFCHGTEGLFGQIPRLFVRVASAGDYFVKVFDHNSPGGMPINSSTNSVTVTLSDTAGNCPDYLRPPPYVPYEVSGEPFYDCLIELEPNDQFSSASSLPLDFNGYSHLSDFEDEDYFSFQITDSLPVEIFARVDQQRVWIQVLDSSLNVVAEEPGGLVRLMSPQLGTYYVRVFGVYTPWHLEDFTGSTSIIKVSQPGPLIDACSVSVRSQAEVDQIQTLMGDCESIFLGIHDASVSVATEDGIRYEAADITTLQALAGLHVSSISIASAPLLADLSGLNVSSLESFSLGNLAPFGDSELRSLDGLEGLRTVNRIEIGGTLITSIDALANIEWLEVLSVWETPITALPNFSSLGHVHVINLHQTGLNNLNGLESARELPAWNNFMEGYASLRVTGNADLTDCSAIAPLLGWPTIPHSPETDHIADEEELWGWEYGGNVHIYGNGEGANSPDDCLNAYSIRDEDGDGIINIDDGFPYISISGFPDIDNDGRPDSCNSDCAGLGMAADLDDDNDGLSDQEELELGTDPFKRDTDGDGWSDKEEIEEGTDPLSDLSQPELPPGLPSWLLYQAASLSTSASSDGINYAAQAFYFDNNVDQLVQDICVSCHRTGGVADGDSDLIFTSSASNNHMQFQAYVNTPSVGAKADELLSNIDGGMGHGGGRVIATDSWQYQLFADYVDRLRAGP